MNFIVTPHFSERASIQLKRLPNQISQVPKGYLGARTIIADPQFVLNIRNVLCLSSSKSKKRTHFVW